MLKSTSFLRFKKIGSSNWCFFSFQQKIMKWMLFQLDMLLVNTAANLLFRFKFTEIIIWAPVLLETASFCHMTSLKLWCAIRAMQWFTRCMLGWQRKAMCVTCRAASHNAGRTYLSMNLWVQDLCTSYDDNMATWARKASAQALKHPILTWQH